MVSIDDYIPAADLPRLIPSSQPGRRLSMATVYRWLLKGQIPGAVRRGPYWFIPRESLPLLYQRPKDRPARVRTRHDDEVDAELDREGIR